MKIFFILSTSFIFAHAISNHTACQKLLTDSGASDVFDATVAHGIHSLTLHELKKFDPLATENNFVPTMNRDMRAEIAILSYAPDFKSKDNDIFFTEPMKVLDSILSLEESWSTSSFNPLEHVAHAFHMRELWARAKKEFDQIGKAKEAPNDDFCACVMDIENNGIMDVMRSTATVMRDTSSWMSRSQFYIQYSNQNRREQMQKAADSPTKKLLVQNPVSTPPLRNPATWEIWKGKADFPTDHHRDVALFLYCAIQKAHQIH